jgi:hypothetical protein
MDLVRPKDEASQATDLFKLRTTWYLAVILLALSVVL